MQKAGVFVYIMLSWIQVPEGRNIGSEIMIAVLRVTLDLYLKTHVPDA